MEIFFVRHGITQSNIERRLMGSRIDEQLIEAGSAQIIRLAHTLPTDFDLIFASPLLRAEQSARLIATILGVNVEIRTELRERDSGDLSGKTWPEVELFTNGAFSYEKLLANEEFDYSPYGGESVAQVWERLGNFLDDMRKNYVNKKLLVVAHGGIIRLMYRRYSPAELPDLSNGSLHKFIV